MPAIIEMRLRPDKPFEPTTLHLHGLACELFEGGRLEGGRSSGPAPGDSTGRAAGHAAQEKPFSVWPLREVPGGWLLRAAWLPPGFPQAMLAACGRVRLGSAMCAVTDLAFRRVTQAELADSEPVDGVRLEFLSPAYFSQDGAHVTAADPRLIVGSWRRHWNAWLNGDRGHAVDRELWRDIHLALHVTGSGLRTETRHTGYRQQSGLVGSATLRLETGASAAVRRALATLARYAEYCGTGAQVTHGFGATRTTLLRSTWSPDTKVAASSPGDVSDHGRLPPQRTRERRRGNPNPQDRSHAGQTVNVQLDKSR